MASKGINKVILIGNLGQNPEIRYTSNGNTVANLNLATSDIWIDKNTGEKKEKIEWHKIVIFGKLAEISSKYLYKGSKIYIEGSLQTRKWKDKKGYERYVTEIIVSINGVMQILSNKKNNLKINNNNKNNNNKNNENIKKIKENKKKKIKNKDEELSIDFDDIPF